MPHSPYGQRSLESKNKANGWIGLCKSNANAEGDERSYFPNEMLFRGGVLVVSVWLCMHANLGSRKKCSRKRYR